MAHVPLAYRSGHLFFDLDGAAWLVDTGAPQSFGRDHTIHLDDQSLSVAASYRDFSAETLSGLVGEACRGLIGSDILGRFDIRLDVARTCAEISSEPLESGDNTNTVRCETFMGIPIVDVVIRDSKVRMFFDTGAQYSYWQDDALSSFPFVARVTDFYPGFGRFEADTHLVEVGLGGQTFELRTGRLPDQLGLFLKMADVTGILGNEVFADRVVTYAPRRGLILFGQASLLCQ